MKKINLLLFLSIIFVKYSIYSSQNQKNKILRFPGTSFELRSNPNDLISLKVFGEVLEKIRENPSIMDYELNNYNNQFDKENDVDCNKYIDKQDIDKQKKYNKKKENRKKNKEKKKKDIEIYINNKIDNNKELKEFIETANIVNAVENLFSSKKEENKKKIDDIIANKKNELISVAKKNNYGPNNFDLVIIIDTGISSIFNQISKVIGLGSSKK